MKKLLCAVVALSVIAGCAAIVHKQWGVVSGSKADGVVKLAFEYGEMEKPVTDMGQAQDLAAKRCQAWGYKNAEPFDSAMTSCVYGPGVWGGCAQFRVTVDFQCLSK